MMMAAIIKPKAVQTNLINNNAFIFPFVARLTVLSTFTFFNLIVSAFHSKLVGYRDSIASLLLPDSTIHIILNVYLVESRHSRL